MTISIEHSGFTSLGTSTAKTQLGGATLRLPGWANGILAVKPIVTIDVPTSGESVLVKQTFESGDFNVVPFEVLPAPIAATLTGTTIGTATAKPELYTWGARYTGTAGLDLYQTALVANTAAPTGSCGLVVTNEPVMFPQRHAKVGTLTSSGTTASTDVVGTAYQITGVNRIVELMGMFGHTTVAAASAVTGYIKFVSSEFNDPVQPKLPLTPISAGLSTIITNFIDGVSRAQVNVPVKPAIPTNITDYLYLGLAPTVAGNFVDGVIFE